MIASVCVYMNATTKSTPQTIISSPVHTAVWPDLASVAVLVGSQLFVAGLYRPPLLTESPKPPPPYDHFAARPDSCLMAASIWIIGRSGCCSQDVQICPAEGRARLRQTWRKLLA